MKTEKLIEDLSRDLEPVRPVQVGRLAFLELLFSFAIVAVGLFIFPARADIAAKLASPIFLFELLMPVLIVLASAFAFDLISIPGRTSRIQPSLIWFGLFLLGAFELTRAAQYEMPVAMEGLDLHGHVCSTAVLLLAAPSVFMLWLVAKRRAITRPILAGTLAATYALAAGLLTIALHCSINNVVHIAVWHLLVPLSLGVLAGTLVLPKILRW